MHKVVFNLHRNNFHIFGLVSCKIPGVEERRGRLCETHVDNSKIIKYFPKFQQLRASFFWLDIFKLKNFFHRVKEGEM